MLDLPPIRSLNDPTIIPLRQPPSPPYPVLTPCALPFNLTSCATNAAVTQLGRLASSRCTAVNRVIEQISACRLVSTSSHATKPPRAPSSAISVCSTCRHGYQDRCPHDCFLSSSRSRVVEFGLRFKDVTPETTDFLINIRQVDENSTQPAVCDTRNPTASISPQKRSTAISRPRWRSLKSDPRLAETELYSNLTNRFQNSAFFSFPCLFLCSISDVVVCWNRLPSVGA